jgi:two-component system chemotaxis sensor kinase CheA
MTEDDEIVKEFLVESHENLDRLDRDLVALEKQPSDREILASIFRTIHTIKGTSGFLAFGQLEAVAHVGENLLAKLRDGQLKLHPELTTALLAMVDAVRQILSSIEATGKEGERNDQELIARLTRLLQVNGAAPARGKKAKAAAARETAVSETATNEQALNLSATNPSALADTTVGEARSREAMAGEETTALPVASGSNSLRPSLGDILISRGDVTPREVENAIQEQQSGDPRRIGEILIEQGAVKSHEVLEALRAQQ